MVITFLSNFINHHQIPFCSAMSEELGDHFHFIQMQPMTQERVRMGWSVDVTKISYVHLFYEKEAFCRKLILESDVVLLGWSDRPDIDRLRLQSGKPTIRISERIYREGQWKAISPRGLVSKYREHFRYRNAPVYLLCAGAYVASDYHLLHCYPEKMFRWGYFPQTRYYSENEQREQKTGSGTIDIAWAGRMITLKHPEYAVKLAQTLKSADIDFRLHMIGDGAMMDSLRQMVCDLSLTGEVQFYGAMEPDRVRQVMELSHIFLFTSNYLEGWGAVVNEAMNSGCALVASMEAGSVPFLIRNGINGLTYSNGSYSEFETQALYLVQHPIERSRMGRNAYETITACWNAEHAAKELLRFCEGIVNNKKAVPAKEGPLSRADILAPPGMMRTLQEDNHLQ
ncbi:MAG: glycosyltransferase family 4 protein [Butyrivibrio sp.]|nr:glycosyltransferase family 4 protein [Butyrivibrio sp.]